jgi:hypothetical protein
MSFWPPNAVPDLSNVQVEKRRIVLCGAAKDARCLSRQFFGAFLINGRQTDTKTLGNSGASRQEVVVDMSIETSLTGIA